VTAQYNAWCRNNGNHETNKRGREDWNSKIVWKMRTELEFQWEIMEDEATDVFQELQSTVKDLLLSLKAKVTGQIS
jgi:hypothetical protein